MPKTLYHLCHGCLLLAALLAGAAEQPYLVTGKIAGLYADTKQIHQLAQGEIVSGNEHEWDKNLLRVSYRGQDFLAHRKYFRSAKEVIQYFDEKRVAAEAEVKGINKQLVADDDRRLKLHEAILYLQHDAAMSFKMWSGGVAVGNDRVKIGDTGASGALKPVVTEGKTRKMLKDWTEEIVSIAEKSAKLAAERREAIAAIYAADLQRRQHQDLFARYTADPRTYRLIPYRVLADRTNISRRGEPQVSLDRHDWVWAQPNDENTALILIRYERRAYTGRERDFDAGEKLEKDYWQAKLQQEDQVRQLENQILFTAERLKLYAPLLPDLRYRSAAKNPYVYIRKADIRPGANGMVETELPDKGQLLYAVNVEQAQSTMNAWSKELNQLEGDLHDLKKELTAAREALDTLDADFERLQKDLAEFRKNAKNND